MAVAVVGTVSARSLELKLIVQPQQLRRRHAQSYVCGIVNNNNNNQHERHTVPSPDQEHVNLRLREIDAIHKQHAQRQPERMTVCACVIHKQHAQPERVTVCVRVSYTSNMQNGNQKRVTVCACAIHE